MATSLGLIDHSTDSIHEEASFVRTTINEAAIEQIGIDTVALSAYGVPQTPNHLQYETQVADHLDSKKSSLLIAQLFLVSVLCSLGNGLITIAIPSMTVDLELNAALVYWPILVYNLVSGSLLLLAGSIADVFGSRPVNLAGVLCLGVFGLSTGFAKNGADLVAMRAMSGAALSLFLPTSVSLVSVNITGGRLRNVGFSLIGVGQVVGYATGLVLGGILVDTVGWRVGYYIIGASLLVLSFSGFFILPRDCRLPQDISTASRIRTSVDWVGVVASSTSLALLAYVLAQISSTTDSISEAYIITLLVFSILLIPGCAMWFRYRERISKPALIPTKLFQNLTFASICIMIMFTFAELATTPLLTNLYFQNAQGLSAREASIKLLPSLVVGGILNFTTGLFIHRIPAIWLVLLGAILSAVSPLLMAVVRPSWPYWWMVFPAQALVPFCADILFTVALLVVSEVFPAKDQALAGAVFNTVNQFGQSLGLAIIGVITNSVTHGHVHGSDRSDITALLDGYRAGFWTNFAWMVSVCFIAAFGLRKMGKVGVKRD